MIIHVQTQTIQKEIFNEWKERVLACTSKTWRLKTDYMVNDKNAATFWNNVGILTILFLTI